MAERVNLALLGAGRWARAYARTIDATPGARLAAVARSRNEPPDFLPPGCDFTTRWQELAERPDIDGVIVATPPRFHAEMAIAALTCNKPVLIEKPLALDLAEAEAVLKAAQASRAPALVEHTQLFNPAYRALKAHLPSIGAVRAVDARAGAHGPFRKDVPILWDWGAHDVAMALDLPVAVPARVTCWKTREEATPEGTGEAYTLEWTAAGTSVRIEISNLLEKKERRFTVYGDRGTLVFDDWHEPKLQRSAACTPLDVPPPGEAVPVEAQLPLAVAVQSFVGAIRRGMPEFASVRLGVDVVRVLDLASRAVT